MNVNSAEGESFSGAYTTEGCLPVMAVLSTTQARRGHANASRTTVNTSATPNLSAGGTESRIDDPLRLVDQTDVLDTRTYM